MLRPIKSHKTNVIKDSKSGVLEEEHASIQDKCCICYLSGLLTIAVTFVHYKQIIFISEIWKHLYNKLFA